MFVKPQIMELQKYGQLQEVEVEDAGLFWQEFGKDWIRLLSQKIERESWISDFWVGLGTLGRGVGFIATRSTNPEYPIFWTVYRDKGTRAPFEEISIRGSEREIEHIDIRFRTGRRVPRKRSTLVFSRTNMVSPRVFLAAIERIQDFRKKLE